MHSSIKKYLFVAFLNYFGYDCAVWGMFDNTIFFAVLVSSFIKSKAWGYAINKQRIHTARSYIRLRTPIFKFIMRTRSQVNLIILLLKTPTIMVIYIYSRPKAYGWSTLFSSIQSMQIPDGTEVGLQSWKKTRRGPLLLTMLQMSSQLENAYISTDWKTRKETFLWK